MTREYFERNCNITVDQLLFTPHYSKTCEVAKIGPYSVYHHFADDSYQLVQDNAVCKFNHDLRGFL